MLKTRISIIAVVMVFSSCKKEIQRNNEISKIRLLTGTCYGRCPVQVIEIDENLTVKYIGEEDAERKGYFIGKINKKTWDSINIKLENAHYKQLDTVYSHSVDDPSTILEITYGTHFKTIRAQFTSLPENMQILYEWLITKIEKTPLEKTQDTIGFNRKDIHLMYPPPIGDWEEESK